MTPANLRRDYDYDFSRVAARLYVGAAPPLGRALAKAGFTVLVLAAKEIQPPDHAYPGVKILRVLLRDDGTLPLLTPDEHRVAHFTAERIRGELERGGRVIVTCAAGINRSPFIAALALHEISGADGPAIVKHIRLARGASALRNRGFEAAVNALRKTKWLNREWP